MALPSGPLRLATSASASANNKPHTFALRYPASHPNDLSTAGAALSSTASGDVSLRIPPGSNPAQPRGRRWAGRQSNSSDVECVVVWDESQHSWILHRIDNVVPLNSDDPEPLSKKPESQPQKPASLAFPKAPRPAPTPEIQPNHSTIPSSLSKHALKDAYPSSRPAASSPLQFPHPQSTSSSAPPKSTSDNVPASSNPQQSRLNQSDSSASSSSANGSNPPPPAPSSTLADGPSSTITNSSQISLALPSKKRALPAVSNPQNPAAHRTYNRSTLSSTSSSGDHGPLRVVQAEDIEEFDFIDSPPDPEPAPPQPIITPSPLTLPSPAPPHPPGSTSWQSNGHRPNTSATAISPAGRPTLSRSSSVADTNGPLLGGSPVGRPTGNHGLVLPCRSAAQQRSSAPSPAYLHNGLSRSANLSNHPTAPSPLHSVAYSSSSSPADPVQTAATPVLVSVSPASATATTTETPAAPAPPAASTAAAAELAHPGRLPASIANAAKSGVSSPVPTWQHTQHVQHSFQSISPHPINGTRSPAPLTNQNLGLNQSATTMPNRTYHRSDSGSSVRESDTDSDDDDDDGESSEDEDNFEPVPPPPAPAPVPVQPAPAAEPVQNSEEDAEADEETDEDEEFELQNFATELEASMMIGDYYGAKAMGSYGESMPEPVEVKEPPPPAPPAKGKAKKKPAGGNAKAATTTAAGGARKGAAAGTSKAKGKAKGAKNC